MKSRYATITGTPAVVATKKVVKEKLVADTTKKNYDKRSGRKGGRSGNSDEYKMIDT